MYVHVRKAFPLWKAVWNGKRNCKSWNFVAFLFAHTVPHEASSNCHNAHMPCGTKENVILLPFSGKRLVSIVMV